MLNSDRQFGVEIEFIAPTAKDYENIRNKIHVIFDGSLRPHQWGGEYVSVPLKGVSGEREIEHACSVLKQGRVDIEHPQTSMHVHLDGKRHTGKVVELTKRSETAKFQYGVSRAVLNKIDKGDIINSVLRKDIPYFGDFQTKKIDNVIYMSRGDISRHPRMNYRYFVLEENDRIPWLTNMFYFYTQYSRVLESIVSRSRRRGNMFCIPLDDSFSLKEIEACETEEDLVKVWYKGEGIGGNYDDSRYHNVNFHCYWHKHGTVEIRSHGGTIDAHKVLLWVRLHQYIADKLEDMSIEDIRIDAKNEDEIVLEFLDFLKDDEVLVEYVRRLLGFFSGITEKDGKIIRKSKEQKK